MNRTSLKKLIIPIVVVAIISGGSYYAYSKYSNSKTTSQSRFITMTATKGSLSVGVPGTGTVVSSSSKDIVASGNGTLTNFPIQLGSVVKQGDSLGYVNDSSINNQVQTDQMKLTQAQQQLTQITNQANYQAQTDQLKLTQAQTQLSQMTKQSDIDNQNITIQQLQNSLSNDNATKTQNINNQNTTIQQLQNTLNNDITTKNNLNLTVPISGTVVALNNQNGDTVQSGKTIATVQDTNHLQLNVAVDELDINKIQLGQKADITFDDIQGKTFTGSVASIAYTGQTSNNVTTYNVVVTIDNPSGIKIGMNGNVNIQVQNKDNVLMVPTEAIQTRNGKKYVMEPTSSASGTSNSSGSSRQGNGYSGNGGSGGNGGQRGGNGQSGSYSGGNRASSSGGKLVEIETGIENQNDVEITSGLQEGQKVLVQLPNISSSGSGSQGRSGGGGGFGGGSGSFGGGGGSFGGGSGSGGGGRSGN
ncbi:efflux RND transporter periplasmic adaptor subunit [Clostridium pasteurianum]|uniref:Membrane-fusion protein n=1 Tax=Clostridium pasteurianum BC1 TaxID=86416 RepID=R4KG67_CLOPA|nr:HlyD family efflux transporter periplasmic adaptor subunit [Clostridium pasteurianum]AGK99499.1 membrane-fusion protein [Clostridium pasteurianum BC1]